MKTKILTLSLLGAIMASCGTTAEQAPKSTPEYQAITIDTTTAAITTNFAAEIQSEQVVEIRPRVSGYLDKIAVAEGSKVRKGQLLFKISDEDFSADYNAALADVDVAKASVTNAQLEVTKLTPLVEKGIISSYELDNAEANLTAALASQRAAESKARNAEVSLSYTSITSPVNGVVGRIQARSGTLVGSSAADALTTVSSDGAASAYFSINENLFYDIVGKSKELGVKTANIVSMIEPASLVLSNGTEYSEKGIIGIASGIVDMTTGSIQLKADFKNSDGMLRTGASAVVRIATTHSGVVVIPQSATYDLQDKVMVYLVDKDGVVASRSVEVYGTTGTNYVIKKGLDIGEVILAEGLDYVKQGDTVKTK